MARSRNHRLLVPLFCAVTTGCDFKGELELASEFDDVYSFEDGMEEWYPRGIDLDDPPVGWDIARTTERADSGAYSVRFQLDNLNDQGKIWIERVYEVPPDQEYEVRIGFDLASADFGDVNLWRLLAGVGPEPPQTAGDLLSSLDTGNGEDIDEGVRWVEKFVVVRTESDEDGELFVYVGLWGTSEFSRVYDVDDVRITMTRRGLSAPTGPTDVAP